MGNFNTQQWQARERKQALTMCATKSILGHLTFSRIIAEEICRDIDTASSIISTNVCVVLRHGILVAHTECRIRRSSIIFRSAVGAVGRAVD